MARAARDWGGGSLPAGRGELLELEELHEQSLVRIHVVDGARSPLALYYELKLGDISATAL